MSRMVLFLLALALIPAPVACGGENGDTSPTEQPTTGGVLPVNSADLIAVDETVLVQLGSRYQHSIPEKSYLEYALKGFAAQPLAVLVTPAGDDDLVLGLFRADDRNTPLTIQNAGAAGQPETVTFTPEGRVEYRVRVFEVAGGAGAYMLHVEVTGGD